MRWVLLALLLAGCGGPEQVASGGPAPRAPVLQGELPYTVVRVSYADAPNPFTPDHLLVLRNLLNTFLAVNSTGLAFPRVEDREVTLDHPAAFYRSSCPDGSCTQIILDQGEDLFPVQTECLEKVPEAGRYRLFLLPPGGPVIYVGYGRSDHRKGGGFGWVTSLDFAPEDLFSLPIPHEVGHMLGLDHAEPGVMSGTDQAAQQDWGGTFAPMLRNLLGWL